MTELLSNSLIRAFARSRVVSRDMPEYGTYEFGRLKYRTAEEARGAARDLGISGVHSHMMQGERVFMPGSDHKKLNKALRRQGLQPTPVPGESTGMADTTMGGMMGMSGGMSADAGTEMPEMPDPDPVETDEMELDVPDAIGGSLLAGDEDDDGDMELH